MRSRSCNDWWRSKTNLQPTPVSGELPILVWRVQFANKQAPQIPQPLAPSRARPATNASVLEKGKSFAPRAALLQKQRHYSDPWEVRPRGEGLSAYPKLNAPHAPAVHLAPSIHPLKFSTQRPKTFAGGLACLRIRRRRTGCSRGLQNIFNRLLKLTETMPIS